MNQHFTNNISNEQVQLVTILEQMYYDNNCQINEMTTSINNVRNTNTQLRNLLVQILNPSITRNSNNTNNARNVRNNTNNARNVRNVRNSNNTNNSNNVRNNSNNSNNVRNTIERLTSVSTPYMGRIMLDSVPYNINSIQQYTIPSSNEYINRTRMFQNFLEPIEVCPTQSQIEAATRNVQYCDIINPSNRSCPISLETFNDIDIVSVIRFCGHIFNLEQLNTWFGSKCTCPICRYDIRNYNSSIIIQETTLESIPQIDISDNIVEENASSEERISNTSNLDFIFDYTLNDDIVTNEILNILDNPDINTVLSFFNNALRK